MIAMIVGTAIALLAMAYVLYPLHVGTKPGVTGGGERICAACGSTTEKDASFCSSCGAPLAGPS